MKTQNILLFLFSFLLSGSITFASGIYEKVSDLLDLSHCSIASTNSAANPASVKCTERVMSTANQKELKAISEHQFYNELADLQIERLQCSQTKAKSLSAPENLSALRDKVNEVAPQLKKLRADINSQIGKNQILNGKIPKSVPPKPGSIEYQRKMEYDERNEEVKALMALESMLISQIPFAESSVIQDLIDQAVSSSSPLSDQDVSASLKKLDQSFENSKTKINKTKSKNNFDLSTDQKIAMGTDEFLISQMIQKNPNNASEIKKLQCTSEKMKNGQQFVGAVGTVASLVIPVGLASAGRLAFLMRAPLMAQKLSHVSRMAGAASLVLGNVHGLENVFQACTKNIEAQVSSAPGSQGSASGQCNYTSETLTADFSSSSCIMNAALQLLPTAGGYLAKKVADRNSLLSKYIFDIQNSPSLKKLTPEEKEAYLKTAGSMTNAQRKASAGILADRSLSEAEKEGLIAAHKIAEGKGYFELSPAELKQKMEKLKGSGFSDDEADLILRAGLAGQMAKTVKGGGSVLDVVEKMSDSANRSRLLGELKTNSVKPDIEASTALFKKSTTQYLEEFKNRGTAPSARELGEIEYVAARWASQTKDPKDLAAATKIYTDAMEKRFKTNGSGRDTGENVQAYLQMLQSDPGKGLHREASEWKRKTIIQYLNSKGWNLR